MYDFIYYFERDTAHLNPTDPNTIPAELVQDIGIYITKEKEEKNVRSTLL